MSVATERGRWAVGGLALLLAVTLMSVGALLGQEGQEGQDPPPPPPPAAEDTVQLVFEREVFSYPAQARRNPFRPLTGPGDAGPRFEELVLLGAITSGDPATSVALLAVGTGAQPTQTYRLRVGQRLGNTRIVEIRSSREIVVVVEEFGLQDRRVMQVRRTAPEATPPPAAPPGGGGGQDQQADTIPPDSVGTGAGGGGGDGGAGGSDPGSGPGVGMNGNGGI